MKSAIIIRYCEIHLKGKNRGYFEKMLKENIKRSIKDIDCSFTTLHSRYLIEDFDENDVIDSPLENEVVQVEPEEIIEPELPIDESEEVVLDDIEVETKSETRKLIEKFVDENPEAAANLLRNWLNEDWGM